jgi:hypothetical protein
MKKMIPLFTLLILSTTLCGCSVYMAARQPDKKDVQLFNSGTPRSQVLAEFGVPAKTSIEDGQVCDTFVFRQGYGKGAKWARGVFHGTADILSVGLWEMVGTPIELIADGEEVQLDVFYGQRQQVTAIKARKGIEVLKSVNSITSEIQEQSTSSLSTPCPQEQAVKEGAIDLPAPAQSAAGHTSEEIKKPTIGIVSLYAAEVSSPNIRRQWMSKATGIGDWYTDPQTSNTIRSKLYGSGEDYSAVRELVVGSLLYYPAVAAAGAYTLIYLPFAATTGAVAGEIDAYEWRACKESFLKKIGEADPSKEFIHALTNKKTSFIEINNSNDFFYTASSLDLKHVLQFEITEIGLQTCNVLGRFSLNIASKVRLWNVETREIIFENPYSQTSNACMKLDAYCEVDRSDFLKTEATMLVQEIAGSIISDVTRYID